MLSALLETYKKRANIILEAFSEYASKYSFSRFPSKSIKKNAYLKQSLSNFHPEDFWTSTG